MDLYHSSSFPSQFVIFYTRLSSPQEGALTPAFGIAAFYLVPSSPGNFKKFTEEEREIYCQELANDWSGDADTDGKYNEVFSWSEVASVFTNAPHVLMMCLPLFFNGLTVTLFCVLRCKY